MFGLPLQKRLQPRDSVGLLGAGLRRGLPGAESGPVPGAAVCRRRLGARGRPILEVSSSFRSLLHRAVVCSECVRGSRHQARVRFTEGAAAWAAGRLPQGRPVLAGQGTRVSSRSCGRLSPAPLNEAPPQGLAEQAAARHTWAPCPGCWFSPHWSRPVWPLLKGPLPGGPGAGTFSQVLVCSLAGVRDPHQG